MLGKLPWKLTVLLSFISLFLLGGCDSKLAVLNPQGPVAKTQYHLIVYSSIIMAFVFIVVMILYIYMVFKYRASKLPADYKPPEIHGHKVLETVWTVIPVILIIAIAIPTVKANYSVEETPKSLKDKDPLTIYVTSSEWKWIFSYPEQGIETVNYVNIPEDRPIKFQLTSSGTMASFWIPELGGQKYTMPNMTMQLILAADHPGDYIGRNANFNGEGFAKMDFDVVVQTNADFNTWVKQVNSNAPQLKKSDYEKFIKTEGLVGTHTYKGTHLKWDKPMEQHNYHEEADKHKKKNESDHSNHSDHSNMDMSDMDMGGNN
ncbi:cytochrome aa3 quinol oxidase subunit II [Heyndrickxia acidiproducens]|uniref:cytochrome aa3 quinol oxidase subunit II n=1 Tax=Heyndrickxia acidiproducens TaxID=1121084 RepID=UPI00037416B7|nr:cytochrome aa3 quinol oxidase subunit II [Heyndrickxia acidiproducens]